MTDERAIEINNICVAHAFYREGIKKEPPPSLEGISLVDMLEATKKVEVMNPRQMVCDHRLIAALYVAYNYESSESDCIEPLAMTGSGKFVCVLQNRRS